MNSRYQLSVLISQVIKFLVFLSLLFSTNIFAQDHWNMELFGQFDRGDNHYSGSWAYIDSDNGKEYALLGTISGTAIYDISTAPIKELFFISGPRSNWREITVIGSHAYIVTEGVGEGEGMQVIDLTFLPTAVRLVTTFDRQFTRAHIISRDIYSEEPFVYISGTCGNCGVEIVDVSDPMNPLLVGSYRPGHYIHDCHVRGKYLYASAFWEGTMDIVDISDKNNPRLVTQIELPGGRTHSSWTTEDASHLVISPEADGLPARIWNIEDLDNLFEVATYTGNIKSLTHNPYVKGDFAFITHNTEGIRVVDIKDPALPIEVGYYDTFDGPSGGFKGLWSGCPYYPSGKIIGGNREDGLYVWTFNNTAANRVYLTIRDATTKEELPAAVVVTNSLGDTLVSNASGQVSWGTIEQEMRISISAEGYTNKDTLLILEAGEQLTQVITLSSQLTSTHFVEDFSPVKVYPNPFKQYLTFEWHSFQKANELILFNLLNQKVAQYPINTSNSITIDTQELPSGFYRYLIKDIEGKVKFSGGLIHE